MTIHTVQTAQSIQGIMEALPLAWQPDKDSDKCA